MRHLKTFRGDLSVYVSLALQPTSLLNICTSSPVESTAGVLLTCQKRGVWEPVSRMRGGDVTKEESGSSADERVSAPRSALRDLKQRVKLHSFFDV